MKWLSFVFLLCVVFTLGCSSGSAVAPMGENEEATEMDVDEGAEAALTGGGGEAAAEGEGEGQP